MKRKWKWKWKCKCKCVNEIDRQAGRSHWAGWGTNANVHRIIIITAITRTQTSACARTVNLSLISEYLINPIKLN